MNGTSGRRVCDSTLWGACECAAVNGTPTTTAGDLAGNQRTDITFAWERTATSAEVGGCLPGDYEGTFGGIYWSYIATLAPIEKLAQNLYICPSAVAQHAALVSYNPDAPSEDDAG